MRIFAKILLVAALFLALGSSAFLVSAGLNRVSDFPATVARTAENLFAGAVKSARDSSQQGVLRIAENNQKSAVRTPAASPSSARADTASSTKKIAQKNAPIEPQKILHAPADAKALAGKPTVTIAATPVAPRPSDVSSQALATKEA